MFSRTSEVARRVRRGRVRQAVVWITTATVALTLAPVTPAAQAAAAEQPVLQAQPKPAPALPPPPVRPRKSVDQVVSVAKAPPRVAWPAAGAVEVDVPSATSRATDAQAVKARAGGLSVAVAPASAGEEGAGQPGAADRSLAAAAASAPGRIRLETLDRTSSTRAKVDGPVLRVRRTDGRTAVGPVQLSVDYSGYAAAFGGDFGNRLRLVRLPDCALTSPTASSCAPQPVRTVNDAERDMLTADVAAGGAPVLYAVAAAEKSAQGNYAATPLTASSKWNVSPSSGAFTWSYPLRVPPVPGGQAPGIALGYNSQTVDGRTTATNNQGSWLGEGFSFEPGYVERRYKSCAEDGHKEVGDLCWSHDNAMLVLNGRSSELVRVGAPDSDCLARTTRCRVDSWRFANDDGSKIERFTGATNGDANGEHWKVTTTEGTQYVFGLNRLPGWSADKPETNSAWTVPVYSDDKGEPCYQETFANAHCREAWRWNLDHVLDRHGNVSSYHYQRETNHYARGRKTDDDGVAYDRGGWLKRIDYGQRDGTVYTANAPARVVFETGERCMPTASQPCREDGLTAATANSWPDVPFDRHCAASTKCKSDQISPTFWTRKRVTRIVTEIRSGGSWAEVDSWALQHLFTNNADGSRSLWLHKIIHEGRFGGAPIAMPSVELFPLQLPNRVDAENDMVAELIRPRLNTVYTDAGGQIDVRYAAADCSAASRPTPGHSTRRCFPVKWHPLGEEKPVVDWFHKYVVERVTESDRTTVVPGTEKNAEMVTQYEYLGDAAWRHGKPDGLTDKDYLTWSEWRGYKQVRVRRGSFGEFTTRTEHTYLRGMHGDKDPDGGTRQVSRADSAGGTYTDHDELAGFEIETAKYDGDRVISKTITTPWRHQTASQTWSWGSIDAHLVLPETTRTFTALQSGGWRETRSTTTYDPKSAGYPDPVGRVTQVDDLGDVSVAADDRCTRTNYADNTETHVRKSVSRVETVAVRCAATPDRTNQVIADVRTYYDGRPFGAAPDRGDVTRTEKLARYDGGSAQYVAVALATHDEFGRVKTATDAAGATTSFAYTETDGLTTKKVETAPKVTVGMVDQNFTMTTEFAPAWGQPTVWVDWDGKRTEVEYDGLGRIIHAWPPDKPRAARYTPAVKYTYKIQDNAPVSVKTEKKKNSGLYATHFEIYDGLLRSRQVQTEGPNGGRLISETLYTNTGQVARKNDAFYAEGKPSDQLLPVVNGSTNLQTAYLYDGADRVSNTITLVAGQEKWRTTTTYGGDRTHVDPPAGGTPTTTVTDARGQVTELLQYKGTAPAGPFDRTTYTHTPAGQLATVTGPGGAVWGYTYDQRGRKIAANDPDAGKSTHTYDDLDRLVSTTDARGSTVSHTYDALGRKVATYQGAAGTGTKLAAWTYDQGAKKELYSSSRFVDGLEYRITNVHRDALYRVLRVSYTIPKTGDNDRLAGRYDFDTRYNADGTLSSRSAPGGGGLSPEGVAYTYDDLQRVTGIRGNRNTYLTRADYTNTGELLHAELNTGGRKAAAAYEYERGTNRLIRAKITRQQIVVPGEPEPTDPVAVADEQYSYDAAGNVLSIADTPAGRHRDIQCFSYDYLRRLTEAWSTAAEVDDPCAVDPKPLGGPAPYHHSFTYDETGNRLTETHHPVDGAAATTRTYRYAQAERGVSHRLASVTSATPAGERLYTYDYDAAGHTTKRTRVGEDQSLAWDAEGRLASATEAGKATTFIYTADGDRLIRKEPNATTLYLPGMEIRQDHAGGVENGTRFYPVAGNATVVQTVRGMQFQFADHHGTGQVGLDASSGDMVRRRFTPFGVERGEPTAAGSWVGEKGFVGGTQDSTTGLTHLGAREYEPETARFISVDPLIDMADPQSMHGYAYAGNNPLAYSDPDGLMRSGEDLGGSGQTVQPSPSPQVAPTAAPPSPDSSAAGTPGKKSSCGSMCETTKSVGGFFKGFWNQGKDTVMGIVEIPVNRIKCNAERGTVMALECEPLYQMGSSLIEDPVGTLKGMWAGISDPVTNDWKNGRKSEAVGRVGFMVFEMVLGTKGASKLKLAKGCPNSFVAGTLVLLSDGKSSKPIEELHANDLVLATDPELGRTAKKAVVATIPGEGSKNLVKITVDTDGGSGTEQDVITATDEHPFWVADLRRWVKATELEVDQSLQTSTGALVRVADISRWTQPARVYNLTVDDIPTYYVIAGNTPVLVHNCPAKVPNLKEFPDVSHLRGADPEEVLDAIPDHWIASTPKKLPAGSDGIRFSNPKAPGQSIIYEEGWPGHSDPVHQGPYLRVSDGTQKTYRIPLAGNPGL